MGPVHTRSHRWQSQDACAGGCLCGPGSQTACTSGRDAVCQQRCPDCSGFCSEVDAAQALPVTGVDWSPCRWEAGPGGSALFPDPPEATLLLRSEAAGDPRQHLCVWEESGGFGSQPHPEGSALGPGEAASSWDMGNSEPVFTGHTAMAQRGCMFLGVISGLCTQGHKAQAGRQPGPGSQPGLHADSGSSVEKRRCGLLAGKGVMWAPRDSTEVAGPLPSSHRPVCPAGLGEFSSLLHARCSPEPASLTSVRRGQRLSGPCVPEAAGSAQRRRQHLPRGLSPKSPRWMSLFLNRCRGCALETAASSPAPEQEAPGGPGRSCCCCSCPAPPAHRHPPWARAPGTEPRAPSAEPRAPSLEHRAPSTKHRAPSPEPRALSTEHRAPSTARGEAGRGCRGVLCAGRTGSGPCLPGSGGCCRWEGPGSSLEPLPLQRRSTNKQMAGVSRTKSHLCSAAAPHSCTATPGEPPETGLPSARPSSDLERQELLRLSCA